MRAHHSRAGHDGHADPRAVRPIRPLDESVAAAYRTNLVVNSRYTPRNFIVKNLYEQFSRPLNFYFLLVAMLQFISVIAPVNPLSTLLPLLFAFTLTAVKEGYDDVKRHRQDHAYNHALRTVLDGESGYWVSRINADICVGDVLVLRESDELPCDVVVLGATSGVYIRTDNLDGEIDLKPKEVVQWSTVAADGLSRHRHTVCQVPSETELPPASLIAAAVAGLVIECPPPSAIVDSFEGRVDLQRPARQEGDATSRVRVPLSHHHLLPQSCVLKNVAQVVCVAVYTGDETKCGMNKRAAPVKWARIDKDVSRYSVYIFVCQMLNAVVFGFIGYTANRTVHETVWYLPQPASEAGASAVIYPLRFFLLTTVMIPVSFKFVVDVCKYYMASTVEWDDTMMHAAVAAAAPVGGAAVHGDAPTPGCKVKNSSILEDLGQIDYLLSDKTGTLTQNVMELDSVTVCPGFHLRMAHLSDATALALPEELVTRDLAAPEAVQRFAKMVALCNTVEVVRPHRSAVENAACREPNGGLLYHAASPDEVALCTGVRRLGVSLAFRDESRAVLRVHESRTSSRQSDGERSGGSRTLCVPPSEAAREETWVVHHTFHFSSEKKSMGVIVEEPVTGRIWFVVKGADDRVLSMASSASHEVGGALNAECAAKLSHYAHRGLRTLLVAYKELTRGELTAFVRSAEEANCLTEGRQAQLDALRAQMESSVTILGITAIEDKLQIDVQETISDMLVAGIKVWMLTGDKMETAEQIGLSCGLYHSGDMIIRVGDGLPALSERDGGAARHRGTAAGPQDWRQELLNFPLGLLPAPTAASPPPPQRGRQTDSSSGTSADPFPSVSAVQKCGKALETRVLRYDPGDAAQLSNKVLRTLADAAEAYGGSSDASPAAATAFFSDAAERCAVLVVQGGTVLESILHDPTLRRQFADISSRCCSVICARTTPSQKAAITQFVRQRGFMTLSVGDGGNDVAMLQEAHVGVGIAGKEGQQAARAADFSITQFSDLRALLFVHGQQAYARTAYVIKYSFYKSMLISFIQLAYNVVGTHASGGTFWNSFSLTMWNGFYTLPQTIFYCFDRCAPRVVLERNPHLYKLTRHAVDIRAGEFFGSFVLRGVAQSIGLLWLCTGIYGAHFAYAGTGGTASNDVTFSVAYTALMLSQLYTVWWESHSVTPLNLLMLIGMPLFYVYSTLTYSARPGLQYYGVFPRSLDLAGVLAALGVSLALTVPSLVYFTALATREPNPRDVLRRAELRRQRTLLRRREYRDAQSWWVRWCWATPEAPSMLSARSRLARSTEREDAASIV